MENKQLKSFKDLLVWQKAADLSVMVYRFTEKFPQSELYGLTNQMRRSVISISSNIAEGFKRNHKKEKVQFYNIAYGSAAELESQIEISLKLNFINQEEHKKLNELVCEVSKMMDSLIKSVNKTPKSYILYSIFFFTFLYSIFYILNPISVYAAQIYFGSNSKEVGLNEKFEIGVFLDTKNESINAIEGNVVFPKELLEFEGVQNGNSVISLWVKQPYILSQGVVAFSGVVPGGLLGNKEYLFSLIFKTKKTGEVIIKSENEKILLNDGIGTKAAVTSAPLKLNVVGKSSAEKFAPLLDTNPPESFQLQVARDENIYSGKWFLVFATQDKGSGIDRYEILEKSQPGSIFALALFQKEKWVRGESPYLLKDQKLRSVILVKAFDRAGNITIAILPAQNRTVWYASFWFWFIIIIISVIFAFFIFIRRKKFSWGVK